MSNKRFVFAYDSEPAIDRTTGFPRLEHAEPVSTAPAAWRPSEHSTFEQPSHPIDKARARGTWRESQYAITLVLLAVTAVSAAVVAALR